MPWKIVSTEARDLQGADASKDGLRAILDKYSDLRFTTGDGRTFALVEQVGHHDRRKLQHLAIAVDGFADERGRLNRATIAGLRRVYGAIAETSAIPCERERVVEGREPEPPMVFDGPDELMQAWLELHRLYGVPLTDAEREWFGIGDADEAPKVDDSASDD